MCIFFSFRNSWKNEHKELGISIPIPQRNQSDDSNLSSSNDKENFVPSTHIANASFDSDSSELDEDVSEESSGDDTIDNIHVHPIQVHASKKETETIKN